MEKKQTRGAPEGARRANGGAPHAARGGRFSAQRKAEAVQRLLRGEDLDTLSRSLGVTAATLSAWRDDFLRGALAALKTKEDTGDRADEVQRLKAKIGELTMANELLYERCHALEASALSLEEVEAVSATDSPSTGRRYGLQREPQKRGPKRSCLDDAALLAAIRHDLAASPWLGEGHRKVWARLRFAGARSLKARILRLMREHGLLAPQRVGRPHGPAAHDRSIIPEHANQMWGTDATSCLTLEEGNAVVFVGVDHASAKCIGIHAAKRGTRWEALEPLRRGVREEYGCYAAGVAAGLKLRHDHGSAYVSDHFQGELRLLGIESSPSFVREPEGNGCAERFIRTLKEQLLWVRNFATVGELRLALLEFKETYNRAWRIERHGYACPAEQHERLRARQNHAA